MGQEQWKVVGLHKTVHPGRPVAHFGDSSFFHSAMPAGCNAVVNRSDIPMAEAFAAEGAQVVQEGAGLSASAESLQSRSLLTQRATRRATSSSLFTPTTTSSTSS
jgi:TPP-dependent indolepyruvate ferredoxin oxidoreductase alpha subunit